jgi:plastocyanin
MTRNGSAAKLVFGLALMAALVASACGKSASPSAGGTTPATQSSGPSSPPPSPSASPAPVTLSETATLTFSPSTITVKEGTQLPIENTATFDHTFTVMGTDIDVVTMGGQSAQATIDLKPGTYPFICRFHVNSGMTGTLIVTD